MSVPQIVHLHLACFAAWELERGLMMRAGDGCWSPRPKGTAEAWFSSLPDSSRRETLRATRYPQPPLFLNLIAPGYRPRRGIAVTRMRSPVPSDGLEPIEPDRVVGLVPLQDGPDPRLLVTRHDHFVDQLEADPDPLAVVLERLRDHRLQLVADAAGVGDLHRPGGVIDAHATMPRWRTGRGSRWPRGP